MPDKKNKEEQPKRKKINPALKYSGMGMQMAISIGIGIFLGGWLDDYFETSKPYFTMLLSIFFLGSILYVIIKDVSNDS